MSAKEWSVIIPALNEEQNLGHCLEALSRLDYDPSAIEVILVDNGSTDQTLAIAHSYQSRLDLRAFTIKGVRVGAIRNAGVKASTGRFLAFLDADCVCEPSLLRLAKQFLSDYPKALVGGSYRVGEGAAWPARLWHQYFRQIRSGHVVYLPTACIMMERSRFAEIGGFNPELVSNEDCEFCVRAREHGLAIRSYPELAVTHRGAERNLAEFVSRQFWHGSNVLNKKALGINVRAVGLAAYMFVCMVWVFVAGLLTQSILFPLFAAILPAGALATAAVVRHSCPADLPVLFVLVLCYGMARASALPIAVVRRVIERN